MEKHEKKAVDIMVELYTQKEALADYIASEQAESKAEGETQANIEAIRNLMKNMKWTAEQAMQALNFSVSEQKKYAAML